MGYELGGGLAWVGRSSDADAIFWSSATRLLNLLCQSVGRSVDHYVTLLFGQRPQRADVL